MITIGKRFTFDAAHRLGRHEGKCANEHGHTYILEIDITGKIETDPVSQQGMIVDYYILKNIVDEHIMKQYDHKNLNVVLKGRLSGDPEQDNVTTAENMVKYFARVLQANINTPAYYVSRVRLQETQNSWAEWRPTLVEQQEWEIQIASL